MEHLPNLMSEKVTQVQEAQRVLINMNPHRPNPRDIIIKMAKLKDKKRILRVSREKQEVTYKDAPIKLAADFSTETLQARRKGQEISQGMKSKGLIPSWTFG